MNSRLIFRSGLLPEKVMLICWSSAEYINLINSLNCLSIAFQFPVVLDKHLNIFIKQDHLKSENCTSEALKNLK